MMKKIIEYISQNGSVEVCEDENLFDTGLLDSMGIIELISIIEEIIQKDITAEELVIDNFKTLNSIESFILSEIRHNNEC